MAESEGSFGMTDDSAGPRPLRRAKVFDGRKDDGSPLVLRPDLASLDEIMRVVGYLKAAPTILLGRGLDKDAWSPDDPPAVPGPSPPTAPGYGPAPSRSIFRSTACPSSPTSSLISGP